MREKMPYKPSHVANSFLYRAKQDGLNDIDHLKIQKLVYYLNGWFLATRGEPVVGENFEAWPYGPVLSSLYDEFRNNGSSPIKGYAEDIDPSTGERKTLMVNLNDKRFFEVFDKVWNKYKGFSGLKLSSMTHEPESPWDKARRARKTYLSNDDIKSHFIALTKN